MLGHPHRAGREHDVGNVSPVWRQEAEEAREWPNEADALNKDEVRIYTEAKLRESGAMISRRQLLL